MWLTYGASYGTHDVILIVVWYSGVLRRIRCARSLPWVYHAPARVGRMLTML